MTETTREPLLRRLLSKTKRVPYAIWMAGSATIAGSVATIFGWLMVRPTGFKPILFLTLLCSCFGCFAGVYVTRG